MSNNFKSNFPVLQNDLIIRAAKGEKVDSTPIYIHRQAGRYLPEFREIRKKYDFFTLCRNKELACEITLQPINRFAKLDAAIIFSDILVIPQALGLEVEMVKNVGPVFTNPLTEENDLNLSRLKSNIDVYKDLNYVLEAINLTRFKLEGKVPLIGFAGAPQTLMAYMVEGCGSKTLSKAQRQLYRHKKQSLALLELLTKVIVDFLVAQVRVGAQMLEIFDSYAGFLPLEDYCVFSLPFITTIISRVKETLGKDSVPITVFAKGANFALHELSKCGCDVIALDWAIPPIVARQFIGNNKVTLQGNLNPSILYGSDDFICKRTSEMLTGFGEDRYIVNLGHGMYPDHDPHSLEVFIDAVKSHKY